MDFGFAIIIDFAMNTDKMNPAYLVGKVMDEIINFQILLTFRKLYHYQNMAHYFSCYKTTFIAFKVFSHLVRILLRLIAMWSSMSSSCFYRREEQVEHNEIGLSYPSRAVLQLPKVKYSER